MILKEALSQENFSIILSQAEGFQNSLQRKNNQTVSKDFR